MTTPHQASNFGFFAEHDPLFLELALSAERAFVSDPNTTLIKLRQLGEALAQHIAALVGIHFDQQSTQADLLYKINRELKLEPVVRELFHTLRVEGNKATHQFKTQHKEAINGLVVARKLAIWFHQSFGKAGTAFKPGPFVAPTDPSEQLRKLQSDISKLQHELQQANIGLDSSQQLNELIAKEKSEYQALAQAMDEEARALAQQASAQASQRQRLNRTTQAATQHIVLDEALTRILIDQQLIAAGWQSAEALLAKIHAERAAATVAKRTRMARGTGNLPAQNV